MGGSPSNDKHVEKKTKPKPIVHVKKLLASDSIEFIGGKVWNTAKLVAAGLPVPPALSLSTEVYNQAVKDCGVAEKLATMVNEYEDGSDPTVLAERLEECRATIMALTLEPELVKELTEFMTNNGEGKTYAVRSSATVEDSGDSAFAGQFDTELNNNGLEMVIQSVKKCWASVFMDFLVPSYKRVNQPRPQMALLVQEQIKSTGAGVLFCQNPLTGSSKEYLINAGFGQGHGVVEGDMPTDQYTVTADGKKIVNKQPATKLQEWLCRTGRESGIEVHEVPVERQKVCVLSDAQILQLAKYGTAISKNAKSPQDIEWAIVDQELYILQARPITAIADQLEWEAPMEGDWNLDLHNNKPLSKLGGEMWLPAMENGIAIMSKIAGMIVREAQFSHINGFCYYCVRPLGKPHDDPEPDGGPPACVFKCIFGPCVRNCCVPEIGKRFEIAEKFWDDQIYIEFIKKWKDELKPAIIKKHLEFGAKDASLRTMSEKDLRKELKARKDWYDEVALNHHGLSAYCFLPAGDFQVLAPKLSGCTGAEAAECFAGCSPVSIGIPGEFPEFTKLLQEDEAAKQVLEDPDLEAADKVKALLARDGAFGESMNTTYSHLCNRLSSGYDVAELTVGENPALVVTMLMGASKYEARTYEGGVHPALKKAAELKEKIKDQKDKDKFQAALDAARLTYHLRDERAIYTDLWAAGILHTCITEVGRRAVLEGKSCITDPTLVREANWKELLELCKGKVPKGGKIQYAWGGKKCDVTPKYKDFSEFAAELKRRQQYRETTNPTTANAPANIMWNPNVPAMCDPRDPWIQKGGPPPLEIIADANEACGRTMYAFFAQLDTIQETQDAACAGDEEQEQRRKTLLETLDENSFTGFCASSGAGGMAHTGIARLVQSADDLTKCKRGDVLVTQYGSSIINSVLPFIGAIVTDGGGVLSHAAICCREAGINCVVGTGNATKRLKDGDLIKVDGVNGVVTLLTAAAEPVTEGAAAEAAAVEPVTAAKPVTAGEVECFVAAEAAAAEAAAVEPVAAEPDWRGEPVTAESEAALGPPEMAATVVSPAEPTEVGIAAEPNVVGDEATGVPDKAQDDSADR